MSEPERPTWSFPVGLVLLTVAAVVIKGFHNLLTDASDDTDFARIEAWVVGVASVAGVLSAVAALVVTVFTKRSVETANAVLQEAREARLVEFRPVVLVTFERRDDDLVLVVAHYRGNPALNVRFAFSPPLVNEDGKDVGAEPPFSTGISVVVPDYRREIRFGDFRDYRTHWFYGLEPDNTETVTAQFEVMVTLTDPQTQDREQVQRFVLDATPLFEFNKTFRQPVTPELAEQWRERGLTFPDLNGEEEPSDQLANGNGEIAPTQGRGDEGNG